MKLLPEVHNFVVQTLVALGGVGPAEVALHGAVDQHGPTVLLPVAFLGAPAGLIQLVGVVVGKGEAVAEAVAGIVDGVTQAAGLADNGDGTVAAGDHLGQTAGLGAGRHQENVSTGVDLLGQFGVEADVDAHAARIAGAQLVEEVLVLAFAGAEDDQLDALLREKQYKLCGILNGIDMEANNPATDPKIPFNYDVTNVEEGKAKCKEALQDKFGLHKDGSPVFAMVSRMVGMKGFDLVQSIADGLVDRGIELVILGSGENQYETFFSDLCARHPGRVGTYIGFEPALSQEIYAGADVFIMPSKSEPCGLAQMVACRYGTPPIVRETGGLRDSIHDCTLGEGNGFTFAGYSAHELYDACCRAQDRYYNKEDWNNLVKHDMECDFSWDLSAKSYEGLYNETANLW